MVWPKLDQPDWLLCLCTIHATELIPNIVIIMIVIIVSSSNTHKQEVNGKHYATALGWVT